MLKCPLFVGELQAFVHKAEIEASALRLLNRLHLFDHALKNCGSHYARKAKTARMRFTGSLFTKRTSRARSAPICAINGHHV